MLCRLPDVVMSQEIIDHVQSQFDSMSREQMIQIINFVPEIDPLFHETIAIWDTQLSKPDCHIPQGQQKISKQCKLAITNITGLQDNYLVQGNWVISVKEPTQIEIRCTYHTHVKTCQPPINLQPAWSAFSVKIKLPPCFKQYSKGFHVALQAARFHLPKFTPTNFRIWTPSKLSKITPIEVKNLKKLTPAPAIPIDQLGAQIAIFGVLKPIKPNL